MIKYHHFPVIFLWFSYGFPITLKSILKSLAFSKERAMVQRKLHLSALWQQHPRDHAAGLAEFSHGAAPRCEMPKRGTVDHDFHAQWIMVKTTIRVLMTVDLRELLSFRGVSIG